MKKFYNLVSTSESDKNFLVLLDGKPVKTPQRNPLLLPTQALAEEIAKEWSAQEDEIILDEMPLTQIAIIAQESVTAEQEVMKTKLLAYIDTDLLCYRAIHPADVANKQALIWDPWLDWFEKKYGLSFEKTTGLAALKQPQAIHDVISKQIDMLSRDVFSVLQMTVSLTGSIVISLAFIEGQASVEEVFEVTHVEENHKAQIYNEDEHGSAPMQEKKQAAMKKDLVAARKFLDLL